MLAQSLKRTKRIGISGLNLTPGDTDVTISFSRLMAGNVLVQRKILGGNWVSAPTILDPNSGGVDTGLDSNSQYLYRLKVGTQPNWTYLYTTTTMGGGGPDEPILSFAPAEQGWNYIRLTWAPTTSNYTVVQIQRRQVGDNWPIIDENAQRGWSNFFHGAPKIGYFSDQIDLAVNQDYEYRIRSVTTHGDNTKTYGDWSYATASTPNVTIQDVTLSGSFDTSGNPATALSNGNILRQAITDAKTITDADLNKVARINLTGLTGVIAVEGPDANSGTIVSLPSIERLWIEGPGLGNLEFRFFLPGGVDPETSYIVIIPDWEAGIAVSVGEDYMVGNTKYRVEDAGPGTAGQIAPSHTTGSELDDNGVLWKYGGIPRSYQVGYRGTFFNCGQNKTQRGLRFEGFTLNGNCRPTGNLDWYTKDALVSGWDTSHKAVAFGFSAQYDVRFFALDGIKAVNWRGECIYSGSHTCRSVLLKDCQIGQCNASAVSIAGDQTTYRGWIRDAANTCNESAVYGNQDASGIYQNIHMIDVELTPRFYWLLSENNPILEVSSSGKYCGATFNQPGTGMLYDRCALSRSHIDGLYLANAQSNLAILDCDFTDLVLSGNTTEGYIEFYIQNKADYNLSGRLQNVLIRGNTMTHDINSKNQGFIVLKSYPELPVNNCLITQNDFRVNGTDGPDFILTTTYNHKPSSFMTNCEFSHNTSTVTAGGTPTRLHSGWARWYSHDNAFDDGFLSGGRRLVANTATWTADPDSDLCYLHNVIAGGSEISMETNPNYYADGWRVRIRGSSNSQDCWFRQADPSMSGLPADINLNGPGTEMTLDYDLATQKWVYVSHV